MCHHHFGQKSRWWVLDTVKQLTKTFKFAFQMCLKSPNPVRRLSITKQMTSTAFKHCLELGWIVTENHYLFCTWIKGTKQTSMPAVTTPTHVSLHQHPIVWFSLFVFILCLTKSLFFHFNILLGNYCLWVISVLHFGGLPLWKWLLNLY